MDIRFIGGSMGCVVGEKIARAIDRSIAERTPLIVDFRVRRRAHAGRRHQPHADGQNFGRR